MFTWFVFGLLLSLAGVVFYSANRERLSATNTILDVIFHRNLDDSKYRDSIREYESLFENQDSAVRKEKYMTVVNHYYDLVTDFYEWGWGQSFHFAPRFNGESFDASVARHEHYLASRLGLNKGMKVLDVGCGVGGPLREIARFSGASITGVNNNRYQVDRAYNYNKKAGLHNCDYMLADFLNITGPDNAFDAAYTIEACVHAPDRSLVFRQIYNKLKPGALLAGYEWCMTDKYDPTNAEHREWKHMICEGNGLPDIDTVDEVKAHLKKAGFELLDYEDFAPPTEVNPVPWYYPLEPIPYKPWTWQFYSWGEVASSWGLQFLSLIGATPPDAHQTHHVLMEAQRGLKLGGYSETFTPMWFFLAQKPALKN